LFRVLCQRLFTFRDPFMDSCLEIPDNDPTSPTTEKISNDAMGKPSSSSKKKKAAEVKRVNQRSIRKTEVQCFRKPKEDGEVGFVTTEVDTAIFPFAQKSKLVVLFMLGNTKYEAVLLSALTSVQVNEVSSMVEIAKNSVISIIDSVITESHEERVRANQNSTG
uniref:PABC domain-containing protein n=1 Tax=Brugia timori TaxID=42155 RepID=A0A0R3QDH2_9BILA